MNRRQRIALLLLVLSLTITSNAFLPSAKSVSQAVVTIGDSYYSPQEVTIIVGGSVLWKNSGSLAQTATSDSGLWNSGAIQPGNTYLSPPFNTVGVFDYHSLDSSQMTGKVIVVPASANTLYPENLNGGVIASYIISILIGVTVIFWLNYPVTQAKSKTKPR